MELLLNNPALKSQNVSPGIIAATANNVRHIMEFYQKIIVVLKNFVQVLMNLLYVYFVNSIMGLRLKILVNSRIFASTLILNPYANHVNMVMELQHKIHVLKSQNVFPGKITTVNSVINIIQLRLKMIVDLKINVLVLMIKQSVYNVKMDMELAPKFYNILIIIIMF